MATREYLPSSHCANSGWQSVSEGTGAPRTTPLHHCLEIFGCQPTTLCKILLIVPNSHFFASRNSVSPHGRRTKGGSSQIIEISLSHFTSQYARRSRFPTTLHANTSSDKDSSSCPVLGLCLCLSLCPGDLLMCFHPRGFHEQSQVSLCQPFAHTYIHQRERTRSH